MQARRTSTSPPLFLRTIVSYSLLLVISLLFASPVLVMVLGSFSLDDQVLSNLSRWSFTGDTMTLENYRDVVERVPFWLYLRNSFAINLTIVVLGLGVNSFAGYALARLRWWGRRFALSLVLVLLIIPFEAIAIPLFLQLSWIGWRDTLVVQIVPFVANPLSIYLFYSFFLRFPRELEEAALIDGAGVLRTFFSIVLPNSKAVFASVAIVTFLFNWGTYLWPLLMTTSESVRPLPLGIANFYTLPPMAWGDILAFGVLMILPVLIVFVLFQRWFVQGVATTGMKG